SFNEDSNVVFNGNGAMGRSTLEGTTTVNAGEALEVTYKEGNGKGIKDGEIKYYKASEYDYKSINKEKVKPVDTGVKTDKDGKAKIKLEAGKYLITAEATGKSRAKALEVEVKAAEEKVKVKVRVEGKDYTILPETEVVVKKGTTNKEVLEALGLTVKESGGMIDKIEGIKGDFYWAIDPWITNFNEDSNVVFNGNGAMGRSTLEGTAKVNAGEVFEVTYKEGNGKGIKDGEIKYYKASEYDYKSINKEKVKPVDTGVKTDKNGKANINLKESGKYFIVAEASNKSRAKALEVEVKEESIPQKLDISIPEETINNYPCEIKVTDESGKPVKDAEIACAYFENWLNNFENCIQGKTDENGKAIIKVSNPNATCKMHFQARKGNIKSDIKILKLIKEAYTLQIEPGNLLLFKGENHLFNVIVKDKDRNEIKEQIKWESLNPEIATVDENGQVTAIKEGEAIIRASVKKDTRYYGETKIQVTKDVVKAHLRIEFEDEREFSGEIRISGKETNLESVLKTPKSSFGEEEKYTPKFNEEGKLVELGRREKGNPYFSVIINGKVIENPKAITIKTGDSIVCSQNGATNQLRVETPKQCTSTRPFHVIVKDEKGAVVEGATIVAGYIGWLGTIKEVTREETNKEGKGNITLNEEKEYYIFAQKDGYVRAVAEPIQVVLPKVEGKFPKEVKNNEDFNISVTDEGNTVAGVKVYWAFKEEPNNKFEIGKTDNSGKVKGKIDAPSGKYTLFVDFHGNTVELGDITVSDTSMYKSLKVGNMNIGLVNVTGVYAKGKIYLFGGKSEGWNLVDSISCFDPKTNEIKNIGKLPDAFVGNSAVVDDNIYLFGNEKVYKYNIEDNKVIEVADLPQEYQLNSTGTAVINKKVYIYERKNNIGSIVEFDPSTKKVEIVANIKLDGGNEWGGPTDGSMIVQANQKMYIIGGTQSSKIHEFNPVNKKVESTDLDYEIQNAATASINGKVYIIGGYVKKNIKNETSYHILELDVVNKTLKPVGYLPKFMSYNCAVLVGDEAYVLGGIRDNKIQDDIVKITGFKSQDTQKPQITVEGIKDNTVVSTKKIAFTVHVTDNVDENIIPEVKCNDKVITEKDGKYNVVLNEGNNTVEITAKDKAGNTETQKYTLIYKSNVIVNKVIIEGSKEKLHPKDKITLKGKAVDEQNNVIPGKEFVFSSSDEKVAIVDAKTGEVTAIGNGTVILTAALKDDAKVKESVKVTVTD
ncbi:Ig-like domain-containing protein, partial [Clostridium lundense]|uniref:Ig-like domain-containing protein n=1 Tax=Clostridium lundense TaxID=319475 RepID=UPI00054FB847